MHRTLILLVPLLLLLCAGVALAQTGSGFNLTWSAVDGGGGASIGGSYALQGTAGQPDAGDLAGGDYTLRGGFWGDPQSGGQVTAPTPTPVPTPGTTPVPGTNTVFLPVVQR